MATSLPSRHETRSRRPTSNVTPPRQLPEPPAEEPVRSYDRGRLGGGIYYDRHEVFGAARLMIHDIELVPDVLAVRERLAASCGVDGSPFLLPMHRTDGTCHWLDIDGVKVVHETQR